jgi:hypothetical protein
VTAPTPGWEFQPDSRDTASTLPTAPTPGTPATTWPTKVELERWWERFGDDFDPDEVTEFVAAREAAAREEGRAERLAWPGGPTVGNLVAAFDVLLDEQAEAHKAIGEMGAELEAMRTQGIAR